MYISKWDQLIHISIQNKISTCAFDVILYTAGNRVESPCHFDCFLSQLVEIYGNFNRSHLIINERPLATPVSLFRGKGTFPQLPQKQYFAFVLITFSSEFSLHVNCYLRSAKTKLVIMSINIRPVIIENMLGSRFEMITLKEDHAFLRILRGYWFPSMSGIRVSKIGRIRQCVFVCCQHGPHMFSSN